eukprot:9139550-Pyramimonas_sp.AAC.1
MHGKFDGNPLKISHLLKYAMQFKQHWSCCSEDMVVAEVSLVIAMQGAAAPASMPQNDRLRGYVTWAYGRAWVG